MATIMDYDGAELYVYATYMRAYGGYDDCVWRIPLSVVDIVGDGSMEDIAVGTPVRVAESDQPNHVWKDSDATAIRVYYDEEDVNGEFFSAQCSSVEDGWTHTYWWVVKNGVCLQSTLNIQEEYDRVGGVHTSVLTVYAPFANQEDSEFIKTVLSKRAQATEKEHTSRRAELLQKQAYQRQQLELVDKQLM